MATTDKGIKLNANFKKAMTLISLLQDKKVETSKYVQVRIDKNTCYLYNYSEFQRSLVEFKIDGTAKFEAVYPVDILNNILNGIQEDKFESLVSFLSDGSIKVGTQFYKFEARQADLLSSMDLFKQNMDFGKEVYTVENFDVCQTALKLSTGKQFSTSDVMVSGEVAFATDFKSGALRFGLNGKKSKLGKNFIPISQSLIDVCEFFGLQDLELSKDSQKHILGYEIKSEGGLTLKSLTSNINQKKKTDLSSPENKKFNLTEDNITVNYNSFYSSIENAMILYGLDSTFILELKGKHLNIKVDGAYTYSNSIPISLSGKSEVKQLERAISLQNPKKILDFMKFLEKEYKENNKDKENLSMPEFQIGFPLDKFKTIYFTDYTKTYEYWMIVSAYSGKSEKVKADQEVDE